MNKFTFLVVYLALCNDVVTAQTSGKKDATEQQQSKISVTKCCRDHYTILHDLCEDPSDEILTGAWQPTVYSHRDNRTIAADVKDFQLTYALPQCPDGYVAKVITDFRLYDDGSLTSPSWKLKAGKFCMDQMKPSGSEPQFVARFCMIDPCNATDCIRKCCPHGMAVDDINKVCQFYSKEFRPDIRNENGSVVDGCGTMVLDGAGVPVCANEMFSLRPALYPEDEFYILPSGELYVVSYTSDNRIHKNCIDTFMDGNITDTRALVCFQEVTNSEAQIVALNIYPYLMFISAVFLIVTFVVYATIAELRNVTGVIIMCYSITLAVMFISLGTIQLATKSINPSFCICLAVIAHYSFLSTFTWLNVMSIATWWDFRQKKTRGGGESAWQNRDYRCRCVVYAIYAWGVPLVIVAVARVMDVLGLAIRPNFGVERCWFSDDISTATYLYGPVGVLILINIIFFLLTIVRLHQASIPSQAVFNLPVKRRLYVIFCLFILMGVSWTMEILSFAIGGLAYIWIPTDILNILTGIFVFIIFVCNRNTRRLVAKKLGCNRAESSGNIVDSISEESQTFMSIADQNIRISTYARSFSNTDDSKL